MGRPAERIGSLELPPRSMRLLAFETSCDETSVAVVRDDRTVEVCLTSSQIDLHRPFGGVVPEVASRAHQEWLPLLVRQALEETGLGPQDFDAVAATRGPGLIGSLLVGVSFAKALALSWGLPWVGVNHLEGHLASLQLADPPLAPPFVALLVSGGHTEYLAIDPDGELAFLGGTFDDAAGEAFDKVAHLLGLGYPGGPAIQKAAEAYRQSDYFPFPQPMKGRSGCDISFSGLKTAVAVALERSNGHGRQLPEAAPYWAASFQRSAVQALVDKLEAAALMARIPCIALVGGVAANRRLRETAERLAAQRGWRFGASPLRYCGDNAAMIGMAAFDRLRETGGDSLDLDADPNLSLRHQTP